MRSTDDLLAQMRAQMRAALPPGAFLRRDRGEALFISNAPALEGCPASVPGFLVERQAGLMRILPDAGWIGRLESQHPAPPDFLCASLLRFRGAAIDEPNLRLFALGAKLVDAGPAASGAQIAAYDRCLRQRAALALRGGCGGGLYACALLNLEIHTSK